MSDAKPRRRRSTVIPITFGPDGFAEHWAFEVPRGFRVALDIRLTERIVNKRPIQVMTIGQPPTYGFRPLDLIASRARNPGEPSTWMLRVVDAEPDAPRDGTNGWVLYECLTWSAEEGRYLPSPPCKISQDDFAHILKHGLPEAHERASMGNGLEKRFASLDNYLDQYGTISQVTDPWFTAAIEGGYTDQARAADLLSRLSSHPLIAAIYPYPNLCDALRLATAPGGWTPDNEESLLIFLQAVQQWDRDALARALLDAPKHLFGDTYASLFYSPPEPLDLSRHAIEVTGAFKAGTHAQLYARAHTCGAAIASSFVWPTILFVADAHIEARVISRKMLDAISSYARRGWRTLIVPERFFPC